MSSPTQPVPVPKFQAIADELAQAIVSGQLAPGEKLLPHRVMAKRLGVTAGTIGRAYASLERQALALARVGDGTYVRNMDAHRADPDPDTALTYIDLAHNIAISTDETDALQQSLVQLSRSPAATAGLLDYQPEAGMQRHRAVGASWLRRFGTTGAWRRVMVTHGAQHALAAVLRTIARPGDTVLTESLSYAGLMALTRSMRLQVIGLEMDEEGLLPDALERAVLTYGSRLLFCTPSLHNPTTSTMSMQRREAIAELVRRHNLLLMEDVVHAAAMADPPPALSSLVPDKSFLLASFSKVMAPGLRVGYLEASHPWLDKVAASIRSDCWMVAPLMPEIVTLWLENGAAEQLIERQRADIAQRLHLARQCLQDHVLRWAPDMPHLFLPLPDPWRTQTFSAALRQAGVLVRTMDHFAAGRATPPQAVRISLNAAGSIERLRDGLQTVARVLRGDTTPG